MLGLMELSPTYELMTYIVEGNRTTTFTAKPPPPEVGPCWATC